MANDFDHKLTIDCPVARNPEIFAQLDASISHLSGAIEELEKAAENAHNTARDAQKTANSANKKVDFLYWFFGAVGGVVALGVIVYNFVKGIGS